mgnify:CR=1 FL=1
MKALKTLTLRSALAVAMAALCFGTTAAAAQEIKARFGTSLPDSHPQTLGARKFAELVEQKSKGRIKISVYSGAQLGSDQQMQAALRGGTQEFTAPSTATLANLVKEFGVFGLPFSFANEKQAYAVFDGPFGQSILAKLADKDIIGLAYWENGWRDVTNSRAPVKTPADLKGLKIRTNNSPMNIAAFKVFGANPIPMPFAEVYTGLETRTIDAQEHPINVVWSAKFFEVQKYLSLTHHAYSPLLVVINKAKFDGLSPEFQQALVSSAQEAGNYQRKLVAEDQQKIIDGMKEAGVEVITDLDRKAFSDALGTQVRDMFVKDVPQGADLLKAVDEVQ